MNPFVVKYRKVKDKLLAQTNNDSIRTYAVQGIFVIVTDREAISNPNV
ncbi:MAG: hypothetical protein AB4080_23565 [Trichodesmium sp.]